MVTYKLTEHQVKESLSKAKQISALLGGKVSKKCLAMGWSEIDSGMHSISAGYRSGVYRDGFEVIRINGGRYWAMNIVNTVPSIDELMDRDRNGISAARSSSIIPVLEIKHHYVLESIYEVSSALKSHISGDMVVDERFQKDVKRIIDFNVNDVDVNDFIDSDIMEEIEEKKRKELDEVCRQMEVERENYIEKMNSDAEKNDVYYVTENMLPPTNFNWLIDFVIPLCLIIVFIIFIRRI